MKYPIPYVAHDEPLKIDGTYYFYSVRWDELKKAQVAAGMPIEEYNDVRAAMALLEALGYAVEQCYADQEDTTEDERGGQSDSGWVIYWK